MKILIQNGRVIDPASGFDQVCDISLAAGRIIAINRAVADFAPHRTIDASAHKNCTKRGCSRLAR